MEQPTKFDFVDQPEDRPGARADHPASRSCSRRPRSSSEAAEPPSAAAGRPGPGRSGSALRLCAPRAVAAAVQVRRIGVALDPPIDPSPEGTAFRAALRDLGYVEGQNLVLAFRRAGLPETSTCTAAELVGQGVDVIVTVDDEATRAARHASDTMPIVMADGIDPVAGRAGRQPRPAGRQRHRADDLAAALGPKRLQLLRAVSPGVSRVAFLWWARTGERPTCARPRRPPGSWACSIIPVIDRNTTDRPRLSQGSPIRGGDHRAHHRVRRGRTRRGSRRPLNATRLPAIYDAGSFARRGRAAGLRGEPRRAVPARRRPTSTRS